MSNPPTGQPKKLSRAAWLDAFFRLAKQRYGLDPNDLGGDGRDSVEFAYAHAAGETPEDALTAYAEHWDLEDINTCLPR